jgi:DNA-binding NarL/FixJ family response regulator
VPIRLVLAEDQYLVREALQRLLETRDEFEVAAVCDDLDSLLEAVTVEQPDVVVTDIRMPPTSTDEGIRAANHLRETRPETGVVVLSQYANPDYALALLEHGSRGRAYLLKERVTDVEELLRAIREVAKGGAVIDPSVVEMLVSARRSTSALDRLTPREREVLAEMAQGKNNAAIAAALVLSERAIEKHANSIFSKLGLSEERDLNRRVKAVLLYLAEKG